MSAITVQTNVALEEKNTRHAQHVFVENFMMSQRAAESQTDPAWFRVGSDPDPCESAAGFGAVADIVFLLCV